MKEQYTDIDAVFATALEAGAETYDAASGWEALASQLDVALPQAGAARLVHKKTRALITLLGVLIVALFLCFAWLFASGRFQRSTYQPRVEAFQAGEAVPAAAPTQHQAAKPQNQPARAGSPSS